MEFRKPMLRLPRSATPQEGVGLIEAPKKADNGGSVPANVFAWGARRIALLADGDPTLGVSVVSFRSWQRSTLQFAFDWSAAKSC